MKAYDKPDTRTALEAKAEALKLSFAPVSFQCAYALLTLGILEVISDAGEKGITVDEIQQQTEVSRYGIKLLIDMGLVCKLVWQKDDRYILDKVGHFIIHDKMVRVNFNFIQDVCYEGLFQLVESIKTGKPEGLKVFGDWQTIYPALHSLPKNAKKSWFDFDHYYSDAAFPEVLPIVFAKPVKNLFDIGGNTGKWTLACLKHDPKVKITIIDLPEECEVATQVMAKQNLSDRVTTYPIDLLDQNSVLPQGADVIWMSQFLDCFSEQEILCILKRAVKVMKPETQLYIMELFWDRQTYEAAAFSIMATSVYFTCMANGNSRMYHSKDFIKLIHQAGLVIEQDIDHIGTGHTLLGCRTGK